MNDRTHGNPKCDCRPSEFWLVCFADLFGVSQAEAREDAQRTPVVDGPICPDNRVMCCLCFDRFTFDELAEDPESGHLTDICLACDAAEHALGGTVDPQ